MCCRGCAFHELDDLLDIGDAEPVVLAEPSMRNRPRGCPVPHCPNGKLQQPGHLLGSQQVPWVGRRVVGEIADRDDKFQKRRYQ